MLVPAGVLAALAALVFISWKSLPALIAARVLSGLALGGSAAAATAYIADLDAGEDGVPTRRAGIVATTANFGGLGFGPLVSRLLARYLPHGLTVPYLVMLSALVIALFALAIAPEGHAPVQPRPRYRPQRLRAPATERSRFFAAIAAVFVTFSAGGLLAGLSGTFLAGPLHHPSAALTGLAVFLTFGSGVVMQTTTTSWPIRRLVAAGIVMITVGLGVFVTSAWTAPPSLALFLIGGTLVGGGIGGIIRGASAWSSPPPARRIARARWPPSSWRATWACRCRSWASASRSTTSAHASRSSGSASRSPPPRWPPLPTSSGKRARDEPSTTNA